MDVTRAVGDPEETLNRLESDRNIKAGSYPLNQPGIGTESLDVDTEIMNTYAFPVDKRGPKVLQQPICLAIIVIQ